MDANEYLLEAMVHERLAARRHQAWTLMMTSRPARPARWRMVLGHALIRLGRSLAGHPVHHPRHA